VDIKGFLKFLFGVEGFVPALISFAGTVLSFIFAKYIPTVPPEVLQGLLALLTIILSAWAGYNGGVKAERMKRANCCK
jgi:hypothetical protein